MKRILILAAFVVAVPVLVLGYPWIYMLGAGRLWDRAEREVHLLPAGYVGPVVILLRDSGGARPERESGARVFRVPANGVLRSRLSVNSGWGRPDYFYVDAAGHRTRVVSGTPCQHSLAGDSVQACLLAHATFSDRPDRAYEAYVVGRHADQEAWARRAERFVDSVVYGRTSP